MAAQELNEARAVLGLERLEHVAESASCRSSVSPRTRSPSPASIAAASASTKRGSMFSSSSRTGGTLAASCALSAVSSSTSGMGHVPERESWRGFPQPF